MSNRSYNVLFLSTGNSARSIMAESLLRKDGAGRFNAFSAGVNPKSKVDPLALKVLAASNYPTVGTHPKSWHEYARADAPIMDFIFILTDDAAGEKCPVWPGQPITASWEIEHPLAVEGSEIEREKAYVKAMQYLKRRLIFFMALRLDSIDQMALGTKLHEIRTQDPAAEHAPTN
jgi:arsenate reductase